MARRHTRVTGAEQRALWSRWKRGESVREIERALGVQAKWLGHVILRHGGIAPAPPHRRRRAPRNISRA